MTFDWSNYLRLADHLGRNSLGSNLDDAAKRTVVSRSYYAAFCLAKAFCVARLSYAARGTGADHGGVPEWLRRNQRRDVATLLTTLKAMREQCDYDDHEIDLDAMVANALSGSQKVMVRLGYSNPLAGLRTSSSGGS